MDCGCNCFGIASSSRFPVKRYNLLVPDIFPKKQPEVSERVDASTERKYKKLYEYIAKNPHRGPKVPYVLPLLLLCPIRALLQAGKSLCVLRLLYLPSTACWHISFTTCLAYVQRVCNPLKNYVKGPSLQHFSIKHYLDASLAVSSTA